MLYLVYSNKSSPCNEIRKRLSLYKLEGYFTFVLIDNMDKNKLKNSGLTYVPTIIVDINNNKEIYESSKSFEFIENLARTLREENKKLINTNNTINSNNSINSSNVVEPISKNIINECNNKLNILLYNKEYEGTSDDYSYLDKNLEDIAQPKSYVGCNDDNKILIYDNKEINNVNDINKIKEMAKRVEEMRREQDKNFI